ncbi:MAG TPA: hypothetical protein VM784_15330 [Actinomycetota bacterium]|nr:hypothetical protein [Actinomycetota bacterium]
MHEMVEDVIVVSDQAPIRERVVVSPSAGKFVPLAPEVFTCEGEWVEPGGVLAEIDAGGEVVPVVSAHRGWVMGMLALPGQPVHSGEGLFWIWGC